MKLNHSLQQNKDEIEKIMNFYKTNYDEIIQINFQEEKQKEILKKINDNINNDMETQDKIHFEKIKKLQDKVEFE